MDNRPLGRQKKVSEGGKGVGRRGEGLNTGPVGGSGRKPSGPAGPGLSSSGGSSKGTRSSGGGKGPISLIIVLVIALLGGKTFLFDGSDSSGTYSNQSSGGTAYYTESAVSEGWSVDYKSGVLNEEVSKSARAKRTSIKGNGKDRVTIMVYMCGTDLESKYGMATADLQEMAKATIADNVNIVVFTGGCKKWNNNVVSNSANQIYQVKNGGLSLLSKNSGKDSLTNPDTLAEFITYCNKKFPADRRELILWDHGGGSISGYGYDEKNASSGSMTLAGINKALKKAGVTFDFIGFDACLMATVENALMLDKYADYLIASEETEPGIGWYYTDWLTALSSNTSTPTIEIGKKIIDDYVSKCKEKCNGQGTTLSIVDLSELSQTVPEKLNGFASSANQLLQEKQYQKVSNARYQTREFGQSAKIDQIDLIDFAVKLNTAEAKELAEVIHDAVKYNKTSAKMTNSYGLSIYFPYSRSNKVDSAVKTYEAIGMDQEYSRCIQSFAKMEVSGQAVSGGSSNPFPSVSGSSSSSNMSNDAMVQMLQLLLGGDLSSFTQTDSKLDRSNSAFLTEDNVSDQTVSDYVTSNQLDVEKLVWTEYKGNKVLALSEEDWSMVHDLALNMFYDDGSGYVDLGIDNIYEFDKKGNLIGETDRTWLAIDKQPVAYIYESTVRDGDKYTITGHVPAYLNGERVNLILQFDQDHPDGYIAGASTDYQNKETETLAKNLIEVKAGDQLDFVCDYYNYDESYENSYYLGDTITLTDETEISNVSVGDGDVICSYRLTDIYNQTYWTESFN